MDLLSMADISIRLEKLLYLYRPCMKKEELHTHGIKIDATKRSKPYDERRNDRMTASAAKRDSTMPPKAQRARSAIQQHLYISRLCSWTGVYPVLFKRGTG